MSRNTIIGIAFIFFTCSVFNVWADDHRQVEGDDNRPGQGFREEAANGFSAIVNPGLKWENVKSQLDVNDNNRYIDRLDQAPESRDEIIPLPLFEFSYNFKNGHRAYLGIPFQDDPRPTVGYQYTLQERGRIHISVFYNFTEEVWKDPYLTGADRRKTDKNGYGGKLEYGKGPLEAGYESEWVDVDKDRIGSRIDALQRSGHIHRFEAGFKVPILPELLLEPIFDYTMADISGKSNYYNGYSGTLALMKRWGPIMLRMEIEGGVNIYAASHPIFDKTREDMTYKAAGVLLWQNPFEYQNISLNFVGKYEKSDSNIDFYDSDDSSILMTVGYRFKGGGRPQ
jgi:hypothetical protein